MGKGDCLRLLGDLGPLDGQADLESGAPRQPREAFLGEHTLDGAHAHLDPLV